MKYSANNAPVECLLTQGPCYQETYEFEPVGILWHDTGANNTNISRYVQPSDDAENRAEMIEYLGKNRYNNDWNHSNKRVGVHAFVGKIANGDVTTVQTLPWNYRPWGCGSGVNGSCNNGWIQFETCRDDTEDPVYAAQCFEESCQLTAYLCKKFNIDPYGTVEVNGVQVPTILCHMDANKLGLASYHVDVTEWYPKHGLTADMARARVAEILEEDKMKFEILDKVKIAETAETYASGKLIPGWVKRSTLYVRQVNENEGTVIVSTVTSGAVTGTVNADDLVLVQRASEWLAPIDPDETTEVIQEGEVEIIVDDVPAKGEAEVEGEAVQVEVIETVDAEELPIDNSLVEEEKAIDEVVEAFRAALIKLIDIIKK